MYNIISIGDSALDTFLELHEASVHCNLERTKCFLCLNYADKIPVEKIHHSFGGNAANFSVGVSRLGVRAAIYTVLGKDENGKQIFNNFEKEKVGTEYTFFDETQSTNCSTVINFQGERTILTYHEKREYQLPDLAPASWVYLTSVSHGHEELYRQVVEHVEKTKAKLIFNPGTTQLRGGIEKLIHVLRNTELLILNKDEADLLLSKKSVKDLLETFVLQYGVQKTVITDAENGSYAFDGETHYGVPAQKVTLIERTGAGDAYAAGLVAALILGKNLEQAMEWGAKNAASVVQYIGAQKGLLRVIE